MAKKSMATDASAATAVIIEDEPEVTPTEEEIAELAYSYWEARGFNGGSAENDWLCAEQELKAKYTQPGMNR